MALSRDDISARLTLIARRRIELTQGCAPSVAPPIHEALALRIQTQIDYRLAAEDVPNSTHRRASRRSCRLCGHGLVNVLLLSSVHAYQRLDRLDHSLSVSNEIAVDLLRRQILRDPRE